MVMGKNDKFWRNTQTGENTIWLVDNTNIDAGSISAIGLEWDLQFADFNADNKTDILWRNTQTGENLIWLIDGKSITSEIALRSYRSYLVC